MASFRQSRTRIKVLSPLYNESVPNIIICLWTNNEFEGKKLRAAARNTAERFTTLMRK